MPILAFIDPWGYKGLTLRLVDAFLKDWGCDCLFFFNYGRINAGLSNPMVHAHMAALFGEHQAQQRSAVTSKAFRRKHANLRLSTNWLSHSNSTATDTCCHSALRMNRDDGPLII